MGAGLTLRLRRLGGRGSVRGSPCDEPARLRFTSLRPPSCGDSDLQWAPSVLFRNQSSFGQPAQAAGAPVPDAAGQDASADSFAFGSPFPFPFPFPLPLPFPLSWFLVP